MDMQMERLPWSEEDWWSVATAVGAETARVEIASRFLPQVRIDRDAMTVTSDTIVGVPGAEFSIIDEAAIVPLIEIWSEFALTPQQVECEGSLHAARTLAIRATNFLTRGQDALIFRGQGASTDEPLFTDGKVRLRSGPVLDGLVQDLATDQVLTVETKKAGRARFAERTLGAVIEAGARLKTRGHYGPYALVLHDTPYGDSFSPLDGTLIQAADRLRPMLHCGFLGTATVPAAPSPTGVLLSLGGNSMDLVIGRDAEARYLFDDAEGLFRFRVTKRFALRLKDPSARFGLIFDTDPKTEE